MDQVNATLAHRRLDVETIELHRERPTALRLEPRFASIVRRHDGLVLNP
ncbi:hypothetical protein WMF38_27960 [Sorangium sp. So ce118]